MSSESSGPGSGADLLSVLLASAVDDIGDDRDSRGSAASGTPTADAGRVVAAHLRHRVAWYAPMVGSLRVTDRELPPVTAHLDADPAPSPLPVALVVTGGAGAVSPALAWAARHAGVQLRSLHTRLRDEDDLARNAARFVTAVGAELPDGVAVHVEVPIAPGERPGPGWSGAVDAVAAAGHRLEVRTSGSWQHDHPDSQTLATVLDAALDRELPVGLSGTDRALGFDQPATGYREHGLLGVLAALCTLLDGGGVDAAAQALEASVGDPVEPSDACADAVGQIARTDPACLRRSWTGSASADVEVLARDLAALGLTGTRALR